MNVTILIWRWRARREKTVIGLEALAHASSSVILLALLRAMVPIGSLLHGCIRAIMGTFINLIRAK